MSQRIRRAFRELAKDIVLRDIERLWENEGFCRGPIREIGGQRISLWGSYENAVDWSNDVQAKNALRVFEEVINDFSNNQIVSSRLETTLNRDGWKLDEFHRIVPIIHKDERLITISSLHELDSSEGIEETLKRISLLSGDDPAGAVGASKELMEATAKTVLTALEVSFDDHEDFSQLIPRVQEHLGLSPSKISKDVDSSNSIKRVLGGLSSIALGIDELRNSEGSGHGRNEASKLKSRHSRLAINAARTWCEIVLDTFADKQAPWRSPNRN